MKYLYLDVRLLVGMSEAELLESVEEYQLAFPEFSKIVYGDMGSLSEKTLELTALLRYKHGYALMAMPKLNNRDVSTSTLIMTLSHGLTINDVTEEVVINSKDGDFEVLTALCRMYGVRLTLVV